MTSIVASAYLPLNLVNLSTAREDFTVYATLGDDSSATLTSFQD